MDKCGKRPFGHQSTYHLLGLKQVQAIIDYNKIILQKRILSVKHN